MIESGKIKPKPLRVYPELEMSLKDHLRALVLIHSKQIAQLEKDVANQAERIEALEKCLEE